ncbi:MAG: hypothetical protein K2L21_09795 [Muribaculaceae bacterium]|nr:hypothetical protein [Muribaculaceae bacterium]
MTALLPARAGAEDSRLATGRWVKVKVSTEGIQQITHDLLREWGFDNPESVAVYGYGGTALALDRIGAAPSDLLPTPWLHTPDGRLLFYGDATVRFDLRDVQERAMPGSEQETLWRTNIYDTAGYYFLSDNPIDAEFTTVAAPDAPEVPSYIGHFHVDARNIDAISPLRMGSYFIEREFSASEPYIIPVSIVDQVNSELDTGGLPRKPQLTFTYCARRPEENEPSVPAPSATATGDIAPLITYSRTTPVSSTNEAEWPYVQGTMQLKSAPAGSTVSAAGAVNLAATGSENLGFDCYSLIYARLNRLPAGDAQLVMQYHNTRAGRPIIISDARAGLQLWDVSDPAAVSFVELAPQPDGTALASMPATFNAKRPGRLILFDTEATHHTPAFAGTVACQNVHATEVPHMAIITTDELEPYARELAEAHERIDGIKVGVYRSRELYNEFSSGGASPAAYRRFAAMLHERDASRFTYLLLLGPSHWDHRGLYGMPSVERLAIYENRAPQLCAAEPTAYATDAYAGALCDDYDYIDMHRAPLTVAVGRIPAATPAKAAAAVERTIRYMENPPVASSYYHAVMAGAEGDQYDHHLAAEDACEALDSCNSSIFVHRLPLIAYPKNGTRHEEANRRLRANLDAGRGLFAFFGHSIGGNFLSDGFYSVAEVESRSYSIPPVAFLGTCEAFGIDLNLNTLAPAMLAHAEGGAIAVVAASRKVYGSENRVLGKEFARQYATAAPGTTTGLLFMNAHNSMMSESDQNKLTINTKCFNLAGDPAVRLPLAAAVMTLKSINGAEPATAEPVAGCSTVNIEGIVLDSDGHTDDSFDGTVEIRIYDTPRPGTVMNSEKVDFEQPQITLEYDLLATANATVSAGCWQSAVYIPAPSEPGGNITIEAHATEISVNPRSAHLTHRGVATLATTAQAPASDTAPAITEAYIDTPDFADGDAVSPAFSLHACIEVPPTGLAVSDAPFAATSRVVLDGLSSTPVLGHLSPAADGSGRMLLSMPFAGIAGGRHTIDIEMFSNAGTLSTASLDFTVCTPSSAASLAVEEMPARTAATFSIDHNIDGGETTIIICDATGATVRTLHGTTVWNLLDSQGNPVPQGIYTAWALVRSALQSCHTAPVQVVVMQ